MAKNQLKIDTSNPEITINIQIEFVRSLINREYMKLLILLHEKGTYFSKHKAAIDAVKELQECDIFDRLVENSLTFSNDCVFKSGELLSVWAFDFMTFNSNSSQDQENLLCSLELKNKSIVLKVENDKIVYLDWTTNFIQEKDITRFTKNN